MEHKNKKRLFLNYRKNEKKFQFILNIILISFGILFLMPFFWAFATSLRLPKDSFDLRLPFFQPKGDGVITSA